MKGVATFLASCSPSLRSARRTHPPAVDPLHRPFDGSRYRYADGLVSYRSLKSERVRFDRSCSRWPYHRHGEFWTPERQLAFWITPHAAVCHGDRSLPDPAAGRPNIPQSIRQIPGAFERATHRAGGRAVTLDALERDVIAGFGDPRALFALGRGAMGGGRLKSEAFTSARLDTQLTTMTSELVTRRVLVFVDASAGQLSVNPIFSWREAAFVKMADKAPEVYAARSALERAVLALIDPLLVPNESNFLRKTPSAWSFTTLTGRSMT